MSLRAGFDDYSVEDMAFVYSRGGGKSWEGLVAWLEEEGFEDDSLDQSSVYHLAADLRMLHNEDVDFTDDPEEAFQLARQHCSHVRTIDSGVAAPGGFMGGSDLVE